MTTTTWTAYECQGQAVAKCISCGRNAPARYVGTDTECLGCAADKSHANSVADRRRLAAEHSAYWATRPPLTLSDLFPKYVA